MFTDVAQKAAHIARSALADVFLDTPVCNAHTTGCDVLWSGVPIVTLPLERMASRVCASLCTATGYGPDMVVHSQDEYEERAVALGTDPAARRALREKLKVARLTCPLFDTRRWVRNLERAFARMWAQHAASQPPHWFQVSESDPLPGGPVDVESDSAAAEERASVSASDGQERPPGNAQVHTSGDVSMYGGAGTPRAGGAGSQAQLHADGDGDIEM